MSTDSRFGTIGAIVLVIGSLLLAAGVTIHEVGTDPSQVVLAIGIVGILMIAVGILGLLSLQFDVYGEESI